MSSITFKHRTFDPFMKDWRKYMADSGFITFGASGVLETQTAIQKCQDVKITKVSNGFIVYVGCKTFVAKTWKEASIGLGEYFIDPVKAEKKYCGK